MKTAVDSSVLLDVLIASSTHHEASVRALKAAYDRGALVASDIVWAEVSAHFPDASGCDAAMTAIGASFEPISKEAAGMAGQLWRKYRKTKGKRERIIPDFLAGAHALLQADEFLTRDRGFYRSYFSGLKLIDPSEG